MADMKRWLLLVSALFLLASAGVLLMYRGIVQGSYLFVTAGTILTPLALADFLLGLILLAALVHDLLRRRNNG